MANSKNVYGFLSRLEKPKVYRTIYGATRLVDKKTTEEYEASVKNRYRLTEKEEEWLDSF